MQCTIQHSPKGECIYTLQCNVLYSIPLKGNAYIHYNTRGETSVIPRATRQLSRLEAIARERAGLTQRQHEELHGSLWSAAKSLYRFDWANVARKAGTMPSTFEIREQGYLMACSLVEQGHSLAAALEEALAYQSQYAYEIGAVKMVPSDSRMAAREVPTSPQANPVTDMPPVFDRVANDRRMAAVTDPLLYSDEAIELLASRLGDVFNEKQIEVIVAKAYSPLKRDRHLIGLENGRTLKGVRQRSKQPTIKAAIHAALRSNDDEQ